MVCSPFALFAYICIAFGDPIIKKRDKIGIALTSWTLSYFHMSVSIQSKDLDFQHHRSWFSFCSII